MLWLGYFLFSFFLSLLFSGAIFWLKNKLQISCSFRWGGVAMILTFIFSIWLNPELTITQPIIFLILGLLGALFFGLWDDWKNLNWKIQLFFQIFLAVFFLLGGLEINYFSWPWGGIWEIPFWELGAGIFLVWLISLINSVNWLDGKDGLLGLLSFFGAAAVFLVSLRPEVNQPALAILSILFLGAVLGFWVFNFPPAKLEAGTSGSYFVGLTLGVLALLSGTKIVTTLLILILPLLDALRVIGERFFSGQSVFSRDEKKRHLHYLLSDIGWSERKIIFFYGFFWLLALWPELFWKSRQSKALWLVGEILIIILFFFWIKRQKNRSF